MYYSALSTWNHWVLEIKEAWHLFNDNIDRASNVFDSENFLPAAAGGLVILIFGAISGLANLPHMRPIRRRFGRSIKSHYRRVLTDLIDEASQSMNMISNKLAKEKQTDG